jgi:hypothetical protein
MQRNAFLGLLFILLLVVSAISAAPAAFTLSTPVDGALIKMPTTIDALTWTPSSDAETYNVYLMRISENTRVADILHEIGQTPEADGDPLTCDTSVCTFTLDTSTELELANPEGQYAWNVEAVNVTGITEASNGPYYFTVNIQPIELVVNGGFEAKSGTTPNQNPWVGVNQTTAKIRCNTTTKTFSNTGECGFLLPAGGGGIAQNVNHDLVLEGDILSLSVAVNTKVAPTGKVVILKVVYFDKTAGANNNGVDKRFINLNSTTTNYTTFNAADLIVDAPPKKVRVIVRYSGATKNILVDDVSLIVAAPITR